MLLSTFPLDYDPEPHNISYLCGMSVPPVMTAQIATEIYEQWLSKIIQTKSKLLKMFGKQIKCYIFAEEALKKNKL